MATIDILKVFPALGYSLKKGTHMEPAERKLQPAGEGSGGERSGNSTRKWMSVKDMGDLLGLRKTDRYWLVHKNVFETETMYGKMWVNVPSFEKWYANQAKYRKITGEEPGLELKKWSLSPRDISEMLEIPEYRVYELIKEKNWETVTVDYWTRVLREPFMAWYKSQKHYRTKEDRQRDRELEERTITFPRAAAMIGLTRKQFYPILKNSKYAHFFDIVEIAGRRRITKDSFQTFLDGQDDYGPVVLKESPDLEDNGKACFGTDPQEDTGKRAPRSDYLTVAEAAGLAKISRQSITKYADQGCFGKARQKNILRIRRGAFEEWLEKRRKEAAGSGVD